MRLVNQTLYSDDNSDTIEQEAVTVSLETAKRLADHHLALAQYWRQVARLPPVMTAASLRKIAEAQRHR